MGLKPLEIYVKNSAGRRRRTQRARPLPPFALPCKPRTALTTTATGARPAGHKRAYCYGPEDTVDKVKKDMYDTSFVKTKSSVLTSAKGEVMENGKPLSDYGVQKGDCFTSNP